MPAEIRKWNPFLADFVDDGVIFFAYLWADRKDCLERLTAADIMAISAIVKKRSPSNIPYTDPIKTK